MDYRCYFCQIKAFEKLLIKYDIDKNVKEICFHEFINFIPTISPNAKAPEVMRETINIIKKHFSVTDPYKEEKELFNKMMLEKYDFFKSMIENSKDKFNTALRLTIAGNIIDFGPGHDINIEQTLNRVLEADFAIDHSENLRKAVEKAENILYLGDNAGEIVMDKLFLETIKHKNVTFAVRGDFILNDVTRQDAELVGIDKVATIIDNGDFSPSTILSRVSDEFLSAFKNADLVIAKGQGNLEGLLDCEKKNLFFLLMAKCQLIGEVLDVETNSFIVKQND